MKSFYLMLLVTMVLLSVRSLNSAEIIPVWNTTVNGDIQDIEFMPGGNQFMFTTGLGEIQIRDSENGELVRSHTDMSNLFMNGYFEFTPDSTRVVMAISGLMQLIDIQSFERIKYFAFGPDSIAKGFSDIILDPIRPLAYVTLKGWEKTSGSDKPRCKVQVYNYETMQLVKDLTPYGEDEYTAIEVSHDGKYLATLNDNKAYLKVWNLETMELIINEPLFDVNSDDWCRAEDIYFSKLDENLIYISGYFTKKVSPKDRGQATFKFNIDNKSRELLLPDAVYASGKIIFLENETILFNTSTFRIAVLNLVTDNLDWY
ncbi:MAG: WD40 repeat domain-containing protein, partial [Candidatus Kapaibacterium sp.]